MPFWHGLTVPRAAFSTTRKRIITRERSAEEAALDNGDEPTDMTGHDGLLKSSDLNGQKLSTLFATDCIDEKYVVPVQQKAEIHHVKWKLLDLK